MFKMYTDKNRLNKFYNQKNKDPIIAAIEESNIEIAQNVLTKVGLNFLKKWSNGYFLLCTAIKHHHTDFALWLISKNCKINKSKKNDKSDSPLYLAFYYNEETILKALLDKYASILPLKNASETNILQLDLNSLLHIAVADECLETVKLVLNYTFNINTSSKIKYYEGFTALHIAINKKNDKLVELLLLNGANVNAVIGVSHNESFQDHSKSVTSYANYTPLHLATIMNDSSIIKLLLNYGADIDFPLSDNGMTALHIAVQCRNKKNVILFSIWNANFKAKRIDGKNVLHLAVENYWYELIQVLILKGANVNEQTFNGETPLYIAVTMKDENIIKLLLSYNADVNIKTFKNVSPLHIAVQSSVKITEILLNNGANVDEYNNNYETPLSIAIKKNHLELINKLFLYQPSIKNIINQSAFDFAIKEISNDNSYIKIVNIMFENGFEIILNDDTNYASILNDLVSQGHIKLVEGLLKSGININCDSINDKNDTLLHIAILSKNVEMVKLLIQYNCDINAINSYGQTPVDYAIEINNLEILNLLLRNGAQTKNLIYPLLTAAKYSNKSLIQLLLNVGSDINVYDEFGTTALHFATWNKNYPLVKFLLNQKVCINTTERNVLYFTGNNTNNEENDSYAKELKKRIFTSPLHIAISKKSTDIYLTLLENYANINSKDGYGRTVLHIAAAMKSVQQKDIIKTLLDYGANINALDDFEKLPIYYIYNQTCMCSIAFQNQYEVYSECECHLYEDYDINDVIAIFVKYITLMSFMSSIIHVGNIEVISKHKFSHQLQISCVSELQKMKKEKICDTISFYDILSKKTNILAAYVRSDKVIKSFELKKNQNKFSLYGDLLQERFEAAQKRQFLLESAYLSFNNILKFKLPEIIAEKIFEYLHLTDLNNISKASEYNIISINNHHRSNANIRINAKRTKRFY